MKKVLFPMLALVLALGLALPMAPPAFAQPSKEFTATISPPSTTLCQTQNYTITINNEATFTGGGVGPQIGSATVTVPADFTVGTTFTVTTSNSKNWTAWYDAGTRQIRLNADAGNQKIPTGDSLYLEFSAKADRTWSMSVSPANATVPQGGSTTTTVSVSVDPPGTISREWTTMCDSDTPWEGTVYDWSLKSGTSQPTVNVSVPTVTLSATVDPAADVTVGFSPSDGTPNFTSTMTINVGAAVTPGVYTITIEAKVGEVVKASTTFTLTVVEAGGELLATGPAGLTHGFWKTNIGKNLGYQPGEPQVPGDDIAVYLGSISDAYGGDYGFLDTLNMEDAYSILNIPDASDMEQKAEAQILALLLTAEYKGATYKNADVYLPDIGQGSDYSGDMSEAIEYILNLYGSGQFKAAKNLADALNNIPVDGGSYPVEPL
jgi:hypothetical protein